MSGELLDALFFHTLLKDSLPDFFVGEEEYDYQAVSDGARTAQKNSFTSAVFKTRIYQNMYIKIKEGSQFPVRGIDVLRLSKYM